MRFVLLTLLGLAPAAGFAAGQQQNPLIPPSGVPPTRVTVYEVGPGVTAPELIGPTQPQMPAEKCKQKAEGLVAMQMIVDAAGKPRNIEFLRPLGTDLDKLALAAVEADRFKPGTHDGAPAAVGMAVEVVVQACVDRVKDAAGKKIERLRLRSEPTQKFAPLTGQPAESGLAPSADNPTIPPLADAHPSKVGGGVAAPVVLNSVAAKFSDAARRAKYQGICVLTLIVDAHGLPQNVQVTRHLDYGLDDKAMEAVNRYRFKPAMKNGQPVPVTITVEVNFRLY